MSTGKKVNELWDCDVEDAILWLENKPLYIFIDAIEFIADCGDNAFTLLQEIYRLADKYSNVYIITSCRTTDSSAFMKINTKYRIKSSKNDAKRAIFSEIEVPKMQEISAFMSCR